MRTKQGAHSATCITCGEQNNPVAGKYDSGTANFLWGGRLGGRTVMLHEPHPHQICVFSPTTIPLLILSPGFRC